MGRIANDDDIGSPKPHSFTPVMLIGCNMICVSCRYWIALEIVHLICTCIIITLGNGNGNGNDNISNAHTHTHTHIFIYQ